MRPSSWLEDLLNVNSSLWRDISLPLFIGPLVLWIGTCWNKFLLDPACCSNCGSAYSWIPLTAPIVGPQFSYRELNFCGLQVLKGEDMSSHRQEYKRVFIAVQVAIAAK